MIQIDRYISCYYFIMYIFNIVVFYSIYSTQHSLLFNILGVHFQDEENNYCKRELRAFKIHVCVCVPACVCIYAYMLTSTHFLKKNNRVKLSQMLFQYFTEFILNRLLNSIQFSHISVNTHTSARARILTHISINENNTIIKTSNILKIV